MPDRTPIMTGGCQCGAIRYALYQAPVSTLCHCRMCQKAVGGPFAALCKVPLSHFAWTRGSPPSFRSSSAAERHFCPACGTPLSFHYLEGDAIEVTSGSLDQPEQVPIVANFGAASRLSWIARLLPGAVPDTPPANPALISRQHPDCDTPADWRPPA